MWLDGCATNVNDPNWKVMLDTFMQCVHLSCDSFVIVFSYHFYYIIELESCLVVVKIGIDPEGGAIRYSISGPTFSVDRDTGVVRLRQPLDREKQDLIEVIISITGELN